MSVVAKFSVAAPRKFGAGNLIELSAVYDGPLASLEDKRFCNATPSGDARIWIDGAPGCRAGDQCYLLLTRGEAPDCRGAAFAGNARIQSVTDFGGLSRQIEICSRYGRAAQLPGTSLIGSFNMRMMVDNPFAFDQLSAGSEDWWVRLYWCADYDLAAVCAKA